MSKEKNKETRIDTNKGRVVIDTKDGRVVVENNHGQVAGVWRGGMHQTR